MSRKLVGRYVLTGRMVTTTALSIGHGDEGADDDIRCVRDGLDRLVIPGTALAGVVRRALDSAAWGSQDDASSVWCEDCVVIGPTTGDVVTEHRDGVGINRETGAADPGVLYRREVVPAGTAFAFRLVVDRRDSSDVAETLAKAIANELGYGRSFGGGTTRGLGATRLDHAEIRYLAYDSRDAMLALLTKHGGDKVTLDKQTSPADLLTITIPWEPVGPMLVSVAVNGVVDRMPLSTKGSDGVRLVVPGSSIKGALRSRAERIMRTLLSAGEVPDTLLGQTSEPLGAVGALFGLPPQRGSGRGHSGRRGAVTPNEPTSPIITNWATIQARIGAGIPEGQAEAVQRAARRDNRKQLKVQLDQTTLRIFDHVAIDRWTGGADDGKLFAVVAPLPHVSEVWQPLTLSIDTARLAAGARNGDARTVILGAITLLLLLLHDLADGYIPLGHGATRGYGEITADTAKMRISVGPRANYDLGDLNDRTVEEVLAGVPGVEAIHSALKEAWTTLLGWPLRLSDPQAGGVPDDDTAADAATAEGSAPQEALT